MSDVWVCRGEARTLAAQKSKEDSGTPTIWKDSVRLDQEVESREAHLHLDAIGELEVKLAMSNALRRGQNQRQNAEKR